MFYTNFLKYCNLVDMSPNAVAAQCGVKSSGTVTGWRDGSMPRRKVLFAMSQFFTKRGFPCSVDDLLSEGDSQETPGLQAFFHKYASLDDHGRRMVDLVLDAEYERCNTAEEPEEKITYIRHYLYSPAAGPNGFVSGEDYEDIPLPADAPKEADYCLTVSGDSMEPYIKDGSLVYVKEDAPLNSMDVGIFFVDGSTYCKQYAPGYTGEIYLLSANPARQDANLTIYPDGGSTLVYFGKVLLDHKLPAPSYF